MSPAPQRRPDAPRVCFVQPHQEINIHPVPRKRTRVLGRYPSLGIAGIGAVLRRGGLADVHVIDSASPRMSYRDFERQIRRLMPEIVGFTSTTIDWPEVVALARLVKRVDPDILVLVGGFQMSCYPEDCLAFPCVDVGVEGDGEETMVEIVEAVAAGRSPWGIAGTWQRHPQTGRPTHGPARQPLQDLDALPFAARDLFPNEHYRAITIQTPFATMVTARGCPYTCRYCGQSASRERYRWRSAESVYEEIRSLVAQGFRELIFFDETFTVNRKRTVALCELMIRNDVRVPWTCRTRVDLVDRELLELMKRAGCRRLQMGIESGSPEVLEHMGRTIDLGQVERGFALAEQVGFERRGYFMLGYLDETEEQAQQTIDMACRMRLDWASFSRVIGLPATPLYEEMLARGVLETDFWREYSNLRFGQGVPYCQDEAYLRRLQRQAYRRFYSRPSVLLSKAKDLRSGVRRREYLRGLELFLAIQLEQNRNVPSTMWRRITGG